MTKINFDNIPCDIKKRIYKINKKKETNEYDNNNQIYYCWYSKKAHKDQICAYSYMSINGKKILCTLLTSKSNECNYNQTDRYNDYKFVGITKKKYIGTSVLKI